VELALPEETVKNNGDWGRALKIRHGPKKHKGGEFGKSQGEKKKR